MPKSNYSDSEGESLTSDEGEGPSSPISPTVPIGASDVLVPPDTQTRGPSNVQQPAKSNTTGPGGITIALESAPFAGDTLTNPQRPAATPGAATARFRASVLRVMQLHRTSRALSHGLAGAEPGVDARRSSAGLLYGHVRARCNIQIIDYSAVTVKNKDLDNDGLRRWLASDEGIKRPSWAKVRWISVGGISYDVVSDLQLRYDLHPLAVEDVLHQHAQGRSKADYYAQWLFLRILTHIKGDDETVDSALQPESILPPIDDARCASPTNIGSDDDTEFDKGEKEDEGSGNGLSLSWSSIRKRKGTARSGRSGLGDPETPSQPRITRNVPSPLQRTWKADRTRRAEVKAVEKLKEGERVNVLLKNLCIFYARDGTIISFFDDPNIDFTAPILLRLQQKDTVLRKTSDASLLIHAMLDLVVDNALEVMEVYHEKILKLERQVLLRPKMSSVRQLHILSGDLILHKRTLEPLKTLIYGLRRYDLDRCIALVDSDPSDNTPTAKIQGYMSHKTKVYLADVHDHMEQILSSVDMFSAIAENLIGYSFNLASFQMNQVMRRFTIVTIICLPLTLLTGYFGQNFVNFDGVQLHSDLFFWEIAIPLMAVIVPLLLWSDFIRMIHYLQKTNMARKIYAAYQR
ncbi:hypothetical protein SISSUDRAFT_1045515 [Sistotremastrum suecicum HHB10207 ss-3]|uniref:Cora-domain-containing protein n=1 Tax=Sistotremastrum suecicum HHB10207 ss-3 TaxID=1314776 RepID=A0A166EE40_9AGAM|nr:hypothetical protein SISSUDRAFT_1045515 [Sistotremastrum suecicum HHB10207 ss-3]